MNTPELTIALVKGASEHIMRKLKEIAGFREARSADLDGLRADFAAGWGLVRASNTTPSWVLRFEDNPPEALRRIIGEFKGLLLKVKPSISFPSILNSI